MSTKVGLLGAGYILDSHANAVSGIPGVSVHAVADLSRGRAERAAAKYAIPHVFDTIEQLAASDCDVVHVLLPPAFHVDAATAMVEAGKSVFLEKPMGLDSAACAALCELAAKKGVALGVNHNFLFSPAYEALRARVKAGELGRIDNIRVDWHFAQPILQFGPFDSWMLAAPANMFFETGSHLGAFVVDLMGLPEIESAVVGNPIALPGGQIVYRHWTAVGRANEATAVLSISMIAGQADRMLRVRGRGASAQLDFGRDISWWESTISDNPIFDSHAAAEAMVRTLRPQGKKIRMRHLKSALAKRPDSNPFEESMFRSISAFYAGDILQVDPRHDGHFGTNIIRLCEAVVSAAQTGAPSRMSTAVSVPVSSVKPTVLVVGGTGFIGRRLVRLLIDRHLGVRVLTRNARAAALEFEGLDVELMVGSHGDHECVRRALDGIKVVYHLAKCEGKRWQDYVDGDIGPTRVLATAALAARVDRFIYTGTIASYASNNSHEVIDNRTPVDPAIAQRSYYSRSKAACEALLQSMQRDGLALVILRPGIVIGPGSPPVHPGVGNFVTETRVDYWGDGTSPLPLVLVDDVADALVRAIDAPGALGQTLLVTSPPLMTARDYVAALSLHMSAQIDARPRAAWRYWAADMAKELAKNAVRHPNRRWPTLHDWRCQMLCSHFDGRMTEQALGWKPVADRETMEARGIADAVKWFLR